MTSKQLNAALLSHCPVVHESAKYGAARILTSRALSRATTRIWSVWRRLSR